MYLITKKSELHHATSADTLAHHFPEEFDAYEFIVELNKFHAEHNKGASSGRVIARMPLKAIWAAVQMDPDIILDAKAQDKWLAQNKEWKV